MKNVQEILSVVFAAVGAFQKAKANDGKVDLLDIPFLLDPLMKLTPAIEGAELALGEWKAASDVQRAEVLAYLKENFDLADDKLEARIEVAMKLLVDAGGLFA